MLPIGTIFSVPERNGKSQEKMDIRPWGEAGATGCLAAPNWDELRRANGGKTGDSLSSHATAIWRVLPAWKASPETNFGGLNIQQTTKICTVTTMGPRCCPVVDEDPRLYLRRRRDVTLCQRLRRRKSVGSRHDGTISRRSKLFRYPLQPLQSKASCSSSQIGGLATGQSPKDIWSANGRPDPNGERHRRFLQTHG